MTELVRALQALSMSDVPRDEAERRFKALLAEHNLTAQQFRECIAQSAAPSANLPLASA
jgi:hypothetical protein